MARRFDMTDEQGGRIEHLLPGRADTPAATAKDSRLFVDAVLRIARAGAGWRDLPGRLGEWDNTFRRCSIAGPSRAPGRVSWRPSVATPTWSIC